MSTDGSERTTTAITKAAAEELRLARIDMSAAERRQLTTTEVITRLIDTWRRTVRETSR